MRRLLLWAVLLACLTGCRSSEKTAVRVFAAVSTSDALEEIGRAHEELTGRKVTFAFGSSGDLARQVAQGAKADLIVFADVPSLKRVEQAGRVEEGSPRALLSSNLVVIVPSGVDAGAWKLPSGLTQVKRLAVADPVSVPAGRYAQAWLEEQGLWSAVEKNVLPVSDARAVVASVASGAAEAGVVYRTEAVRSGGVAVVYKVPRDGHGDVLYPVALIKGANPEAKYFLERLCRPESTEIFRRRGFEPLGCQALKE